MRNWVAKSRAALPAVVIVAGACASGGEPATAPAEPPVQEPATPIAQAEESIASPEESVALPDRPGPRRETTGGVPHVQLDAAPVPAVDAELRRRVFQLPGVDNRESDRSLPGARGLSFSDEIDLARPDVIAGSSEFAHIHPDGSLHVWLAVDAAAEVDRTLWGELHPWVERDGFWDGVVMIYTPETFDELDIAIEIVVEAYNFVTGADLDPTDIA